MKRKNESADACWKKLLLGVMAISMLLAVCVPAPLEASMRTRIAVLPFYAEEGRDVSDSQAARNYRRLMGFVQNRLVDADFDVVDPFARDLAVKEYSRLMETARQDSALATRELSRKYAVDAVYLVWLTVKLERTPDQLYRASAQVDGSGYDSGGRSLGLAMFETFRVTRRDADEAVGEVEKEVGDLIGKKLTAWNEARPEGSVVWHTGDQRDTGGVMGERIRANENTVNIRLDGATEYEVVEIFGKVLNTVRGVSEARLFASTLVPNNPQACRSEWVVQITDTEPFRLQANIMKMANDIIASDGDITIDGIPYRYTKNEVTLMNGLRTGSISSREIQFVIDRDRARERERTR